MSNIVDIQKFFKLLNKNENAVFTYAWFDAGGSILQGFGCIFGGVPHIEKQIEVGIERGVTLHTTLNQTGVGGRRTEHIQSCRVLCLDLDRVVGAGELEHTFKKLGCHMIVESSREKYHVYWKVSPCIPLDRWSTYQVGLAFKFNGDLNMGQVTHMVRVPGFERVCKDGTFFVPRIVFEDGEGMELTEKGVLHLFPDIGKWGEEGKAKLAEERKEMGRLARDAWKGRVGELNIKHVPKAGRNTVLYFTVKDASFKEKLGVEDAVLYGLTLNKCLENPLSDKEVADVATKAWNKAQRALEWQQEKDKKAINCLNIVSEVSETSFHSYTNENKEQQQQQILVQTSKQIMEVPDSESESRGNGYHKSGEITVPEEVNVNFSDRGIDAIVDESLIPARNETSSECEEKFEIPKSLMAVAKKLGAALWDGGSLKGLEAVSLLDASLRMKQYQGLGEYICRHWEAVGVFRKEGIKAHIREKSVWGSDVYYAIDVSRENFQAIIAHAVKSLDKHLERGVDAKQKLITDNQLMRIAAVCFATAGLWDVEKRQDEGIIVFQNGVYRLSDGVFTEDLMAPLKYSHPVWCRFDHGVEEKVNGVNQSGALVKIVPTWSRFMDDWFPGDENIRRVLLRFMGYSMTTAYGRQKFAFFYGPTRAGKGSIARILCGLVGSGNYCAGDYSMLDGDFKTAGIHDKLVICFEEVEGSPREHDKRMGYLKKLLGGERVMFNRKYQDPFEDSVIGKFILQSNEPPNYQDKGHAIRARMLVVGFEKSFEGESQVDPALEILRAEADCIGTLAAIAWSRAAKENNPFFIEGSQALEVGKREVGDTIDIIGACVKNYVVKDPDGRVKSSVLIELIKLVAEIKTIVLPGRPEVQLKQEISTYFPLARHSKRLTIDGDVGRGYFGISINIDAIHTEYPEIEDNIMQYRTEFPNLMDVLTIKRD